MSELEEEIRKWIEKSEEPEIMTMMIVLLALVLALLLIAFLLSVFDLTYGIENAKDQAVGLWNRITGIIS